MVFLERDNQASRHNNFIDQSYQSALIGVFSLSLQQAIKKSLLEDADIIFF